ncbi:hypothetical protein LCGC14_2825120, partial [marine sediment metagenome]
MTKKAAPRKTYWELLKHPNWQKKRLEVLEAHKFECQECGENDVTLHVHHSYYEKGCKPWEYPSHSLWCLCEKCHQRIEKLKTLLNRSMGKLCSNGLETLIGFAMGLELIENPKSIVSVSTYGMADGIGCAHNLSTNLIIEKLQKDDKMSGDKLMKIK